MFTTAHGRMLESYWNMGEDLLASKLQAGNPTQKKIFISMEALTPEYTNSLGYDLTVGYHRKASVWLTYAGPITSGWDLVNNDFSDHAKDPASVAVYLNSACNGDRQEYVGKLLESMPGKIKSLGKCHNNDQQDKYMGGCGHLPRYQQKICIISKFKFYLAFENTIIDDYVTEKFYGPFMTNTIPVYRGAKNIYEFAPGKHSFINAHDFATPKDLANYLLYLDGNQTAYDEYFNWRKDPLSKEYLDKYDKRVETMYCRICEELSYLKY